MANRSGLRTVSIPRRGGRRTDDAKRRLAIVGAGARRVGALAIYWLEREVESVVLESQPTRLRRAPERALAVLEQGTVDLLGGEMGGGRNGCNERGWFHQGIELRFGGRRHRIPAERFDWRPCDHGVWTTRSGFKDFDLRCALNDGGRITF